MQAEQDLLFQLDTGPGKETSRKSVVETCDDDAWISEGTNALERRANGAHPWRFNQDTTRNRSRSSDTTTAAAAVLGDVSSPAAVATELRSLTMKIDNVVAGQREMRSALQRLCGHALVSPIEDDKLASRAAVMSSYLEVANVGPKSTPQLTTGEPFTAQKLNASIGQAKKANGKLEPDEPISSKSRSSFNAARTKDDDMAELRQTVLRAEKLQERDRANQSLLWRVQHFSKHEKEFVVDACIGVVVSLNAIFIGYSIDAPASSAGSILAVDVVFCTLFVAELILRIRLSGLREHFFGEAAALNIFDACLVIMDTLQLLVSKVIVVGSSASMDDLNGVSVLRVIRLVRLARLLRLLRFSLFDDLVSMVGGLTGGLSTLFWALVLYMFSLYCVSLVFREAFGSKKLGGVYEYFQDVPRSMFTVFRCSFGDCSSREGQPIFEHVEHHYGMGYSLIYVIMLFCMTVGLFNVISAVFVDATMHAAGALRYSQKKARLKDSDLWARKTCMLMRKLAECSGMELEDDHGSLTHVLEELYDMDVEASAIQTLTSDPEVKKTLSDLDIDPEDHDDLAEILDPDQNGSITLSELMDGLRRLRGEPKRSDIVQINILLHSIMGVVQGIQKALTSRPLQAKAKSDMAL
eukprot:TRINITY_DN824_c0_g7_i1.p1 TRINITY_DN824_c0_g7~~TRINITY_DN824_c0_g7_i1.p1  ORF type:complete len:637 (-),score=97.74 TRINITY_DN824_c0_g7_i1:344-2254(-)